MRTLLIAAACAFVLMAATTACLSSDGQAYGAQVYGIVPAADPTDWIYEVQNTSSGLYALWLFQIEVDPATDVISVGSPDGWTADTKDAHFIKWTADVDAGSELMSGDFSIDFTAKFSRSPEYQNWSAMLDSKDGTELTVADGGEVLVQSTPEPGGAVAIISGLVSLIALRIRKKNR